MFTAQWEPSCPTPSSAWAWSPGLRFPQEDHPKEKHQGSHQNDRNHPWSSRNDLDKTSRELWTFNVLTSFVQPSDSAVYFVLLAVHFLTWSPPSLAPTPQRFSRYWADRYQNLANRHVSPPWFSSWAAARIKRVHLFACKFACDCMYVSCACVTSAGTLIYSASCTISMEETAGILCGRNVAEKYGGHQLLQPKRSTASSSCLLETWKRSHEFTLPNTQNGPRFMILAPSPRIIKDHLTHTREDHLPQGKHEGTFARSLSSLA